ncbi:riboflavin biosynthesis protein RibA [Chitiniphilus purpureus]|uniref:Riboflavin biosynthesis protein RibA n=1 Tax=Chitiniphilus purpureus TaxID=2981137 RepID=A0ABY6DKN0_9NEIS|nr:riboflavin biosynthesis protein RibA [Chitiniphilus sp. CD1]UXY14910.1 riboflavin biosynthesis protein RibA [Chitiniphilus sp. CD1]
MISDVMFGETARTKIAALFDSESAAARAIAQVRDVAGIAGGQVRLVQPGDTEFGRKLEPESGGIVRTAIRAHLLLGAVGIVVSLLIYAVLFIADVPAVASNPGVAAAVMAFFGLVFGLLAGGLATARPDHQAVIAPVREALSAGRWAVVVHPASPRQCDEALRVLHGMSRDVVRTL